MEKLSSTKLVPGAKKVGDRCCKENNANRVTDVENKLIVTKGERWGRGGIN